MLLRRHKDIIAIKTGDNTPVGFHARNLEVAELSEEAWNAMAPSTFGNGFVMELTPEEAAPQKDAFDTLNEWNQETSAQVTTRSFSKSVNSLTLNVTQICNLHCSYCAAGGDGTYGDPVTKISVEKTLPQLRFFLEKLALESAFHITFIGGEPLLYPDSIRAIMDYTNDLAATRNISTSYMIITNGTLLTEKVVEKLAGKNVHFTVSIDGPPDVQDRVRPQRNGKGSAAQAFQGLEVILKNRDLVGRIQIHSVFTKDYLEVSKSYEYLRQYNPDCFEFTFDVTESDTASNQTFMAEMTQVAAQAFSLGGEKELRKITLFDNYFRALDNQTRTENYCGSGKSLLSIDSRNQIFACPLDVGHQNERIGQDLEVSQGSLESLQKPFIESNNCQSCWARFLCGGGCLFTHKTLTGSKNRKHPSFCERTRYLISLTLLYYERSRGSHEQNETH